MKSLNQGIGRIAKINLSKIFSNKYGKDEYSIFFSSVGEIDLQKEISCRDSRDAKGKESPYFNYSQYHIWGLELGIREIEMLSGDKTLFDRIVEADAKNYWEQYREGFTKFSHIVEEIHSGETNVCEKVEIVVYKITDNQWKQLFNKACFELFDINGGVDIEEFNQEQIDRDWDELNGEQRDIYGSPGDEEYEKRDDGPHPWGN